MIGRRQGFIGVACRACSGFVPLFPDRDPNHPIGFAGPGLLVVTCDRCGVQADYKTAEIKRRSAPAPVVS